MPDRCSVLEGDGPAVAVEQVVVGVADQDQVVQVGSSADLPGD